ncbi:putative prolyl 4-hydroxylase 9 [Diplonema papillatum]|nr:putative prolyl 4-hydroxylase 9 [Diplonema papillatum]
MAKPSSHLVRLLLVAAGSTFFFAVYFIWPSTSHSERLREHGVVDYFSSSHSATSKPADVAHVDGGGSQPKPATPEPVKVETFRWMNMDVPKTGEWDFHGLKTNYEKAEAPSHLVRTDYDVSKINASLLPRGYEPGDNPAFKYPEPNDRLFVTVALKPRILYFPRVLSDEEADIIISKASPRLVRSQVAITESQRGKMSSTQEVRTSKSTWVTLDNKLQPLNDRLTALLGVHNHEPMNVLLYGPNQHYDAHHDYFDPSMYGQQSSNRMATFFLYLNDTEAGGATTIPRANGARYPANFKEASCNQGLQVYPKKGSAILLYDMRPDRSLDAFSLHGGCDVINGTKWGGVVWFRTSTPPGTGKSHE